jgi:hypothetical protein
MRIWYATSLSAGVWASSGLRGASETEPILPLGTYAGSYSDESTTGATRAVIMLKTSDRADFIFNSDWSGYEATEAIEGSCEDVHYAISARNPPHFTLHMGGDDECVQEFIAKANSQIQSGFKMDPSFNFYFTSGPDYNYIESQSSFGGYNFLLYKQQLSMSLIFGGSTEDLPALTADSTTTAPEDVEEEAGDEDDEDHSAAHSRGSTPSNSINGNAEEVAASKDEAQHTGDVNVEHSDDDDDDDEEEEAEDESHVDGDDHKDGEADEEDRDGEEEEDDAEANAAPVVEEPLEDVEDSSDGAKEQIDGDDKVVTAADEHATVGEPKHEVRDDHAIEKLTEAVDELALAETTDAPVESSDETTVAPVESSEETTEAPSDD